MKAKVISDANPFENYSGKVGKVLEMSDYITLEFDDGQRITFVNKEVEIIK